MRTNEHSYRSLCHEIITQASLELALEGLRMTQEAGTMAGDLPTLQKQAAKINEHAMMLEESKGALAWLEGLPDDLCPEVECKTMADVRVAAQKATEGLEEKMAKLPPDIGEALRAIYEATRPNKKEGD